MSVPYENRVLDRVLREAHLSQPLKMDIRNRINKMIEWGWFRLVLIGTQQFCEA